MSAIDILDIEMFDERNDPDTLMDDDPGDFYEDETQQEKTIEQENNENEDIRAHTLKLLEDMVLHVLQQLSDVFPTADGLGTGKTDKGKIVVQLADRKKLKKIDGSYGTRCVVFPQKRYTSSRAMAQLFKVIDIIHEAITEDIPTTKRDVFYQDVKLFGTQAVVDKLVDDIAATLGVERADLRVRASCKGLFCGAGIRIHMQQGDIIRGNATETTLIPSSEDITHFEVDSNLSWVLVVEKEAVFQTLCHLGFAQHPDLSGSGLIITGKGYPDLATRHLVCTLSKNLPLTIPILALVDADPYGIDILSVYKHGSSSMTHQQDSLSAQRVTWIGIMASELVGLGIDQDALLPITKHDEKKALSILRRQELPRKWRKELQHMLFKRRKAEIEILSMTSITRETNSEGPDRESQDISDDFFVGRNKVTALPCPQANTLVKYLITKIEKAVCDCAGKYTQTRLS